MDRSNVLLHKFSKVKDIEEGNVDFCFQICILRHSNDVPLSVEWNRYGKNET